MDNLLNVFTPAGFRKVCATMVITGTKDLVFDGTRSWKNLSHQVMKEKVEEVKRSDDQEKLRSILISNADVTAFARQAKITTLIAT